MTHTPKDFGYKSDNPGPEYCERKQRWAVEDAKGKSSGMAGYMLCGPVTAWMGTEQEDRMYMPVEILQHIDGANDEQMFRRPGDVHFDELSQNVREQGWNQKYPVMVRVNHLGRAYIMEGNTRKVIARLHGVKDVMVAFYWVNGAEKADNDLWSPKRVAAICTPEPRPFTPVPLDESEDSMNGRPMEEPKVLYRSVSVPELEDIRMRGRVMGGKNDFNDFDARKLVFFGDTLSESLIQQGEEIERQATHRLKSHRIHNQFRNLEEDRKQEALFIIQLLRQKVEVTEEEEDAFVNHGWSSEVLQKQQSIFGPLRGKIIDAANRYREIEDKISELQSGYRNLHNAEMALIRDHLVPMLVTSAVLVTKPITGGIHYSSRWGQSGMGHEDEYGFEPGEVSLDDIDKIILISRGEQIAEMTPEEMTAKIDRILQSWKGETEWLAR